jgi:hypothetical protein
LRFGCWDFGLNKRFKKIVRQERLRIVVALLGRLFPLVFGAVAILLKGIIIGLVVVARGRGGEFVGFVVPSFLRLKESTASGVVFIEDGLGSFVVSGFGPQVLFVVIVKIISPVIHRSRTFRGRGRRRRGWFVCFSRRRHEGGR